MGGGFIRSTNLQGCFRLEVRRNVSHIGYFLGLKVNMFNDPAKESKPVSSLHDIKQSPQTIHSPRDAWELPGGSYQFSPNFPQPDGSPPTKAQVRNSPWAHPGNAHSDSDNREKPRRNEVGEAVKSWSKKTMNAIIGALDQTCVSERSQKLEGDKIKNEYGG